MTTATADAKITEGLRAEEFRAATERAAVFPSNAGRLRLTGEDARDLLNRLSTNLVDPHGAAGEVAVTVLTSDRGRIVDLVYVVALRRPPAHAHQPGPAAERHRLPGQVHHHGRPGG